jgi:glycosyltransferase involved in cell wall biosynthesis
LKDPHPRSVIEAMAVGLPVIAFATDGVSETVVHNETGLLVEPQDVQGLSAALMKLLLDRKISVKFGQNGQAYVENHFSAEATARQIAEIIDQTLRKSEKCRHRH